VLIAQDHRPEDAYELRPLDDIKRLANSEPILACLPGLPRPIWFFAQALSIGERQNRPYYQSTLHLLAGPERIESGWWDNHLVQRDYFIAEDEQNNLYWLYRQRFPAPGWFIQGRFG
jgi:protein ImuB